jgi:hypothetical protein
MSNLKKVLALALALAMVMGFSISASAVPAGGFTDKGDIRSSYVAAVDLLTELAIINGMTEDTFVPAGNLTRAQYAKMLYVIFNRGVDDGAVLYAGLPHNFADVYDGAWFDGYVSWMYGRSWVSGRDASGTVFGPNDPVTGFEALKMSLVALGYDQAIEKFANDAMWKSNVMNRAQDAGLLNGLDSADSMDVAIRRDAAAQILHNTLFATLVQYNQQYIPMRAEKVPVGAGSVRTLAQQYYNLSILTGVALRNSWAGVESQALNTGMKSSFRIREIDGFTDWNPDATLVYVQFPDDIPLEILGHEVTIYARQTVAPTTTTVGGYDKIYGAVKRTARSAEVTKYTVEDVTSASLDGSNTGNKKALAYYVANGDDGLDDGDLSSVAGIGSANAANTGILGNYKDGIANDNTILAGSPITFIDNNGDGNYDYINARSYWYSKVTAVGTTADVKITAMAGDGDSFDGTRILNAVNSADIYKTADLKVDDRVLVYKIGSKFGAINIPVTTATLTAAKENSAVAVIGGNEYKEAKLASRIVGIKDIFITSNFNAEKDYRMWENWVLEGPVGASASLKWALVLRSWYHSVGLGTNAIEVELLLEDGTKQVYTVSDFYKGSDTSAGKHTMRAGTLDEIQIDAYPGGVANFLAEAGMVVKADVSADSKSVTLFDANDLDTDGAGSDLADVNPKYTVGDNDNSNVHNWEKDQATFSFPTAAGNASTYTGVVLDNTIFFAVELYDDNEAAASPSSFGKAVVFKGRSMANFRGYNGGHQDFGNDYNKISYRVFQDTVGIAAGGSTREPIVAASVVGRRVQALGNIIGNYAYVLNQPSVEYQDGAYRVVDMLLFDGTEVKTYKGAAGIRSDVGNPWTEGQIDSPKDGLLADGSNLGIVKGNVIQYATNSAGEISSMVTITQYDGGDDPYSFNELINGNEFGGNAAGNGHAYVGHYYELLNGNLLKLLPSGGVSDLWKTQSANAHFFALDSGVKVYHIDTADGDADKTTYNSKVITFGDLPGPGDYAQKVIAVTNGASGGDPIVVALFYIEGQALYTKDLAPAGPTDSFDIFSQNGGRLNYTYTGQNPALFILGYTTNIASPPEPYGAGFVAVNQLLTPGAYRSYGISVPPGMSYVLYYTENGGNVQQYPIVDVDNRVADTVAPTAPAATVTVSRPVVDGGELGDLGVAIEIDLGGEINEKVSGGAAVEADMGGEPPADDTFYMNIDMLALLAEYGITTVSSGNKVAIEQQNAALAQWEDDPSITDSPGPNYVKTKVYESNGAVGQPFNFAVKQGVKVTFKVYKDNGSDLLAAAGDGGAITNGTLLFTLVIDPTDLTINPVP